MAEVTKKMTLYVTAGQATPTGKIGPALGQAGVNIGEFVNQFNEATKDMGNVTVPAVVSVYEDRSFDFVLKSPPTTDLIKKTLNIEGGSSKNRQKKVGTLTQDQVRAIAEEKMNDLSANDTEAAAKIVEGSARSMGVEVK